MAVPIRLSDAVDLYDESIKRTFDGKYKAAPETYKQLCEVDTTNLYIDKSSAFTGFSTAKQFSENESVLYESPDQGFDISWTQREFGLGFAVTKKLWKFDRKNIIKKLPGKLADALVRKREKDVQDYLYECLAAPTGTSYTDSDGNTISITGGDGKGIFSKTHAMENDGTAENNITYNGSAYNTVLSETGFDNAENYVAPRILDGKEQKMVVNYKRLLIPKALWPQAARLMKTDRKVGSADWDKNIYFGAYEIVVMPYFNSSGDAFWILYDPNLGSEGLTFKWSQPVSLEGPELVFDTGSFKYKSTINNIVVVKFSLIVSEIQKWITRAKDKILSTLNDLTRELQIMEMQKSELCV